MKLLARFEIPNQVWLCVVLIEHEVEQVPVQVGFDALTPLSQDDRSLMVLLGATRRLTFFRASTLGAALGADELVRERPLLAHPRPPMLESHLHVAFGQFFRLLCVMVRVFRQILGSLGSHFFALLETFPGDLEDHVRLVLLGVCQRHVQVITDVQPILIRRGRRGVRGQEVQQAGRLKKGKQIMSTYGCSLPLSLRNLQRLSPGGCWHSRCC